MRTIKFIIPALLLVSFSAKAQTSATETDSDFDGRASVNLDWKIVKGLHLDAGYELRTADSFSRIERNQVNVGISYSPVKHLKLGAGYYYIGHYNSDQELNPRHRFYVDAEGSYKFGAWKLSLRERAQMTHNSYDFNRYQNTPNLVELKSRLKLSYKRLAHVEPYAFVELRNCFNGPSVDADYSSSTGKYTNYSFSGYSDAYLNRVRGALGFEWNINKNHSIDFRLMEDWCHSKSIDTNAKGTKLKSWSWEKAMNTKLAVGYTFSF